MAVKLQADGNHDNPPRASRRALFVSLLLLIAVIVFTALHAGEARRFIALAEQAEPAWLLLALLFQLATYFCAASIWQRVLANAHQSLPLAKLARLSVEKLSIDQFVPTGGLSGNLVVARAMGRTGLPAGLAADAVLVDVLSHYSAYAIVAAVAFGVLWWHHEVTHALAGLLGLFAILVAAIPLALVWLLLHRHWQPSPLLARIRALSRLLSTLQKVSPGRVLSGRLLGRATSFQLAVYVLDAATLWAMLRAIGVEADPLTAFVALIIATIAGTLSMLPGGIGGFEAASVATLTLLGVPVEAALTATLLLRGLSLWLPLFPGLWLARDDFKNRAAGGGASPQSPDQRLIKTEALAAAELERLFEAFDTSPAGLGSREAALRLQRWGPNQLAEPHGLPGIGELLRSLTSPLPLILITAAIAAAFLGEVLDAFIIVFMVVLSATVNFWQSLRSAKAVKTLQQQITATARVLRDGVPITCPRSELVVGDVVRLTAGDLVPADARLLESVNLHVQQAALTGESLPVEKVACREALVRPGPDSPAMVYVGTSVISGSASALVYATGGDTAFGDIARRLASRPEETEFERGSRQFGILILKTVFFLVLFAMVVSILGGRDPMQSVLFALALAVGLTPEYLPMITTVTLAQGARRMASEKVIVRHLASIQNLGSIDILCSDKTGTLTSGNMSLTDSTDPFGKPSDKALHLASLNSAFETGVSSPLDAAILQAHPPQTQGWRKLAELPFDFERRRLSVLVEHGNEGLLITKGAPENVLPSCSQLEVDGRVEVLDDENKKRCLDFFDDLSRRGFRVLALARRDWSTARPLVRSDEQDMVLVGFLSFADEVLDGVGDVLRRLAADGIAVKILTGDNELVTRSVCKKVGIEQQRVITGAEVEKLDEFAFAQTVEEAVVFARVSPAQKHRIVMALKHRGHVVGFLGDGINDAPSLHSADVGISVAGAAEVAQEAADILLLEKRLHVLHGGIIAGRRSFANVTKYLLMGTSSNFGNMLSMAGAVIFLPFLPMLPTQILVNNFLYDMAQITIPTDRVDPAYLARPQRWNIGVIRRFMLLAGPVSSVFDFVTFAILIWIFQFGETLFQTGWFVESLITQVLVLFVIRTRGAPWARPPSVPLVITALTVVVVAVLLPFSPLAAALGMAPLPFPYFVFVALVVPVYLLCVQLIKTRIMRGMLPA